MGSEGGNSRYAAQHVIFVRPNHTDADAMKYLKAFRGNNTNPTDATLEAFVKGARENINYMKFLGAKDPKVEIRAEIRTRRTPTLSAPLWFTLPAVGVPFML